MTKWNDNSNFSLTFLVSYYVIPFLFSLSVLQHQLFTRFGVKKTHPTTPPSPNSLIGQMYHMSSYNVARLHLMAPMDFRQNSTPFFLVQQLCVLHKLAILEKDNVNIGRVIIIFLIYIPQTNCRYISGRSWTYHFHTLGIYQSYLKQIPDIYQPCLIIVIKKETSWA